MGDCDDFAILMSSLMESIGAATRVVLIEEGVGGGGHLYSEVYLGNRKNKNNESIYNSIKWLRNHYSQKNITATSTSIFGDIWLNLDWNSTYPGGDLTISGKKTVIRNISVDFDDSMGVNEKPVPVIDFIPKEFSTGESITFLSGSSTDDGNIKKRHWDFGDGFQDEEIFHEHIYKKAGPYIVKLNVTDDDEESNTTEIQIIVKQPPKKVLNYYPENPLTGEPISFNAKMVEGKIINYNWSFGDGSFSKGPEKTVETHTYNSNGTYKVDLNVTDDTGLNRTISTKIRVNNPPRTELTWDPKYPNTGEEIDFDAKSSLDTDGKIKDYFWSFGDGTSSNGIKVSHAYEKGGNYTFGLLIRDNDNATDSTQRFVNVNSAPIASFTTNVDSPTIGEKINFDASSSIDLDDNINIYEWDFGDGSKIERGRSVNHQFQREDDYPVKLTVIDDKGLMDSQVLIISIQGTIPNDPPIPFFTLNISNATTNDVINFEASMSIDPDGYIKDYIWDFGDDTKVKTGISVNHQFLAKGNFAINLTVIDDKKQSASFETVIPVLSPSEISENKTQVISSHPAFLNIESFTFTPNPVCAGDTTKLGWATSGATGVTITPGIGIVESTGFRILSPKQTMGYTLRAWNTTTNTKPMTVLLRVEQCIEDLSPSRDQTANIVYDFIEEAHDQGQWLTGPPDEIFHFGGRSEDDNRGSAMWENDLSLNDMTVPPRVLQVIPPENGYISGTYRHMNYIVQSGDRLIGRAGFVNGSEAGNAIFSLFLIQGNANRHLWGRSLSYGDSTVAFDIPLGDYAGWQPAICLKVDSNGPSVQDKAVWQDVRIIGSPQRTNLGLKSTAPNALVSSIFDDWDTGSKLSTSSSDIESSSAVDWLNRR
jgi:PKD repeat protein